MSEMQEITIEESRGKVQRNLHFWVIGVFAIIVAIFIMVISLDPPKQSKEDEEVKVDSDVEAKPEQLQRMLTEQEQKADKFVGDQADLTTPYVIPSAATEGVRTDPNAPQGLSEEEVERRRREALIAQSGILVIDTTNNFSDEAARALEAGAAGNPDAVANRIAQLAAQSSQLEQNALSGFSNEPPPQPAPLAVPPPSVFLDRQWADQQANVATTTEKIREDGKNPEYTIFQGAIIPTVLITSLTSDLPGEVIAQTTQDVYDGVKGNHLIIPKGSKVYGVYNNDINVGQGRIMLAFQRIVMPGGRSVTLPGLPAMDSVGQTGVVGDVNNHYFRLYGGSALVAAISAVVDAYGKNNTNVSPEGPSVGTQVTSSSGQVLVDVSRNIMQRNNNIRPTITIKQGEKLNIMVKRDIEVLPYGAR